MTDQCRSMEVLVASAKRNSSEVPLYLHNSPWGWPRLPAGLMLQIYFFSFPNSTFFLSLPQVIVPREFPKEHLHAKLCLSMTFQEYPTQNICASAHYIIKEAWVWERGKLSSSVHLIERTTARPSVPTLPLIPVHTSLTLLPCPNLSFPILEKIKSHDKKQTHCTWHSLKDYVWPAVLLFVIRH